MSTTFSKQSWVSQKRLLLQNITKRQSRDCVEVVVDTSRSLPWGRKPHETLSETHVRGRQYASLMHEHTCSSIATSLVCLLSGSRVGLHKENAQGVLGKLSRARLFATPCSSLRCLSLRMTLCGCEFLSKPCSTPMFGITLPCLCSAEQGWQSPS